MKVKNACYIAILPSIVQFEQLSPKTFDVCLIRNGTFIYWYFSIGMIQEIQSETHIVNDLVCAIKRI